MGKSKKTLALVMALVMAFTIVPFGAWYGFKAAAEEPTTYAAADDYYVPATELVDGKAYYITSDDSTHMAIDQTDVPEVENRDKIGSWNFTDANRQNSKTVWYYSKDSNGAERFSHSYGGKMWYFDLTSSDAILFGKDDAQYTVTAEGEPGRYSIYRKDKNNVYLRIDSTDCVVTKEKSYVRIYEILPEEGSETINLPIQMLDFHADKLLFNLVREFTGYFDLIGNSAGNLPGITNSDQENSFRTDLTVPKLDPANPDMIYSRETVEYVANALKKAFTAWDGWHSNTPAGAASYYYNTVRSRYGWSNNSLARVAVEGIDTKDCIEGKYTKERWTGVEGAPLSRGNVLKEGRLGSYDATIAHKNQINYKNIVDPTTPSTAPGGTLYDLAYYMLSHFFVEDTTQADRDTSDEANGKRLYNKQVGATSLQLKKHVTAGGKITYVYDSAYPSDWGDNGGIIKNTSLSESDYRGNPTPSTAYFTPLDNVADSFGKTVDKNADGSGDHNYNMSLHGSGKFVYHAGDELYFEFTGDDDVYLYIDNQIVIDLGGAHGPVNQRVNLNDLVASGKLNLKEGSYYDFDFYYLERNAVGSNLHIETNIRVAEDALVPQKIASTDAAGTNRIGSNSVVANNTKVYYGIGVNNFSTDKTLYNTVLNDEKLGVTLSANKGDIRLGSAGVDVSNMTLYYASVNDKGEVMKVEDSQKTNDPAAIADFINRNNVEPGHALYAVGIGYTLLQSEHEDTRGIFQNRVVVTAKKNGTEDAWGEESFTLRLVNIDSKVFVLDFISNSGIQYAWDKVFTGLDEVEGEVEGDPTGINSINGGATSAIGSNGGTLEWKWGETVKYTPKSLLNTPEVFTLSLSTKSGYTMDKTVTFTPANNVYYDDEFNGVNYGAGWQTAGTAAGVLTGMTGTEVIYGNDNEATHFTDSIHYVQGNGTTPATAYFTFTGEGFSLYMDTCANSGDISVKTTKIKDADGNDYTDKSPVRDRATIRSEGDYKDVPVVNRVKLGGGYGTYRVDIAVSMATTDYAYLKGIRVYNPMGTQDTTGIYVESEQNAKFIELRDNLINGTQLTEGKETSGVLYIDGNAAGAPLTDYAKSGPKNEIYLDNGQGIAFKVADYADGMKLQVSARKLTADADPVMTVSGSSNTNIASTLDMYYEVVANDGLVTITNTGNGVLALTNLKVTGNGVATFKMMASRAIAEEAFTLMQTPVKPEVPVEPEVPEEPETPSKPENPIVKFFNTIKDFFNKLFGRH